MCSDGPNEESRTHAHAENAQHNIQHTYGVKQDRHLFLQIGTATHSNFACSSSGASLGSMARRIRRGRTQAKEPAGGAHHAACRSSQTWKSSPPWSTEDPRSQVCTLQNSRQLICTRTHRTALPSSNVCCSFLCTQAALIQKSLHKRIP